MYARKIAQLADTRRPHMRRGCGTLTYRRNKKKSRKAPVVREVQITRHRQLFLVFLFSVSQFFFLQSSMFVVNDVTVTGEHVVKEETIRKAMDLQAGSRYWDLSADSLTTDILELNALQSANVSITFPGRVQVRVAERKPIFTAASIARSKQLFNVDKEGVVVSKGSAPKGSLQVVLPRELKIGGLLSSDELEVCNYLHTHITPTLKARLAHLSFDKRGDVTLRIAYRAGKIPVRLGRPEKLSYKLFLLEELLSSLKAESADVVSIDLRFSTPIVRQPYQAPATPPETPPE